MLLDPAQPAAIGIGSGTCRVARGRESTWGWARGHCDTGRGARHSHAAPMHPDLIPDPCCQAGDSIFLFPSMVSPKSTMRHTPSSPCTAPSTASCAAQTGTGVVVAAVTASPQTTSSGGHGHQLHQGIAAQHSPSWHIQRDKVWGRAAPRSPSYLGLPRWHGTLGQKGSAKGTLRRQRTLQNQVGGSGCILPPSWIHPASILPPHAGGPGQSSPSPSPLHPDPTAKG